MKSVKNEPIDKKRGFGCFRFKRLSIYFFIAYISSIQLPYQQRPVQYCFIRVRFFFSPNIVNALHRVNFFSAQQVDTSKTIETFLYISRLEKCSTCTRQTRAHLKVFFYVRRYLKFIQTLWNISDTLKRSKFTVSDENVCMHRPAVHQRVRGWRNVTATSLAKNN